MRVSTECSALGTCTGSDQIHQATGINKCEVCSRALVHATNSITTRLASVFLWELMMKKFWIIWKFRLIWSTAENALEQDKVRFACAGFLSQILAMQRHPVTGHYKLSIAVMVLVTPDCPENSQHLSKENVRLTEETCLQNFRCNSVLLSSIKWFCVEDNGSIITCLGAINTAFSTKFYPWHSENRPAIINIYKLRGYKHVRQEILQGNTNAGTKERIYLPSITVRKGQNIVFIII